MLRRGKVAALFAAANGMSIFVNDRHGIALHRFPVYDIMKRTSAGTEIVEEGCSVTVQELLNDYLTQLGCTARELSAASGISAPVIADTGAAATART